MPTPTAPPPDLHKAGADLLTVTLRQLRAWDEEAAQQRAAQTGPDDQARDGADIHGQHTAP